MFRYFIGSGSSGASGMNGVGNGPTYSGTGVGIGQAVTGPGIYISFRILNFFGNLIFPSISSDGFAIGLGVGGAIETPYGGQTFGQGSSSSFRK